MIITSLAKIPEDQKESALIQIKDIFFDATSRKEFISEEAKGIFFKRWCGDYQTFYSEEFFVVTVDNKVLGYLSGCSDSLAGKNVLNVPGYNVFEDLFLNFPAHLHINFHSDARGKGLGSILVNHYIAYLHGRVKGLHLITSPDAKNMSFYERLGFTNVHVRDFKGSPLQFMGRILE